MDPQTIDQWEDDGGPPRDPALDEDTEIVEGDDPDEYIRDDFTPLFLDVGQSSGG